LEETLEVGEGGAVSLGHHSGQHQTPSL
jgi:hypothetical protein